MDNIKNKSFDDTFTILRTRGIKMTPCTIQEVERLESFYHTSLPAVYKAFLLTMGNCAGNFMLGSDCFYSHLFQLKSSANELLTENNLPPLPENTFVFWMHQGYQFQFFYTDQGDNPPVYYFIEDPENEAFTKVSDTLTDNLYFMLYDSGIL